MGWRKDATERRSIWPYSVYENHIKLDVTGRLFRSGAQIGETFNGKNWKYEKRSLNSSFLIWQVFKESGSWNEMILNFELSMQRPEKFATEVFSSENIPICVYAIDCLCKSSRWRSAVVAPYNSSKAYIEFHVKLSDLSGSVVFAPSVLLWEDRTKQPPAQARLKGSRVATGFPFQIQIDEPMDRPGRGLQILWHSFPEEISDALYELIIDPPKPILKLNNAHPSLKLIIEDLSKLGNRARIRNALFSLVGVDAWMQLARFAARTENLESEDDEDPYVILSRKILRTLTKLLKCSPGEILDAFEDHQSSNMLRLRLQHHFRTAARQDSLITGLTDESAESSS